ncbi:LysR family transcriptional regulator [Pusillimonas sp.]|uniref:LysR family transcriptional regulator n=1 Tax=Pusillimonas sp. TaxID=3040095 RepID=UPI0037C7BAA5
MSSVRPGIGVIVHPKHLKTFAAVCHEGSMKRAGESLRRSRSAVSYSIEELERDIGGNLFERHERGMLLTEIGTVLLRRVEAAFAEMGRARQALEDMAEVQGVKLLNAPIFTLSVGKRRLEVLLAFADLMHMGAVAGKLGISQPAVSLAVNELDLSTGLPLFHRSDGNTRLTPAGETLLLHLKRALAELRHAGAEITLLSGRVEGKVIVGALPFGGAQILPVSIARLLHKHPGLHIATVEGSFENLAAGLWCGDIDLVVGALQPVGQYTTLVCEKLFDDWISIIARAGHPLAQKPNVGLDEVLEASWVLPSEGTPTRAALTAVLDTHHLPHPRVTVETSDPSTIRGLLCESDLITAAAQRIFHHDIQTGALVRLPVVSSAVYRSIGIIRRAPERSSPGARLLMDELRAVGRSPTDWE